MTDVAALLEPWTDRLTGSGQIVIDRCPYCDKRRHLYVSGSNGAWICFRCEAKGDLAKLYAALEGITYDEAVVEIKSEGIRRLDLKPATVGGDDPILVDVPDEFIPCYDSGMWSVPTYLTKRRIERRTIKAWRIGYCNKGRYRNRIVIPFKTERERSFVARAALPDMHPPYLGPQVDEGNGRRFLPGYEFVNKGDPVVVCEGIFDALRLWQAGLKPLALLGKGLGKVQRARIANLSPSHVVVMLDADAWIDARRITSEIAALVRDVRVVMLDDGDPDDHAESDLVDLVARAESVEAADRRRIRGKLADLRY